VTVRLEDVAAHLDARLATGTIPDYPNAVNGVQFSHRGPVRGVAAAVDASAATIAGAAAAGANLLLVHHGLFWGGVTPITGFRRERIRLLVEHDIAVYSAHLPLDSSGEFGNSRLLAERLGLAAMGGFAHFNGVACGVRGECALDTGELLRRVRVFAASFHGNAVATPFIPERLTRHWGICSGAGANPATIAEAVSLGIDTLIVGEGPHWTAVDAPEQGLVIVYAGHYATETLGVQALASHVTTVFGIPNHFVDSPTGL
jgi:dinuclear metal center YbgI/SA1388 family protein